MGTQDLKPMTQTYGLDWVGRDLGLAKEKAYVPYANVERVATTKKIIVAILKSAVRFDGGIHSYIYI